MKTMVKNPAGKKAAIFLSMLWITGVVYFVASTHAALVKLMPECKPRAQLDFPDGKVPEVMVHVEGCVDTFKYDGRTVVVRLKGDRLFKSSFERAP